LGYGFDATVKLPEPVAEPEAVVMDTAPVPAPGMTNATKVVPVFDTEIAFTPPILRAVGLLKLVPVIVTSVPTAPLDGVKDVMTGACENAKWLLVHKTMTMRIADVKNFFICGL
jgi:hypothetical protein